MTFKSFVLNSLEKGRTFFWHRKEVAKQKDKRRVKLAKRVRLTKEQKREIDSFYKTNYGRKINYRWHKIYTAISGKFDYKYFAEYLYTPDFQRLSNDPNYRIGFQDKNILPLLIKGSGINVKAPENIFSCSNGIILDSDSNIVTKEEMIDRLSTLDSFFIKQSIGSNSGDNCWVVTKDKFDKNTFENEILLKLGKNFVVQSLLKNQKDVELINPTSVNSFRVITYIINDVIYCSPIILRVGRTGNYRDNAHAGGLFVAVSNDGEIISNGKTEFGEDVEIHPDSKIRFKGYRIKNVNKILIAAKKVASLFPRVGVIDWDFILDEKGDPVCLEANMFYGSVWLIQMSHGVSVFGDNTAKILQIIRNNKRLYE